MPPAAGSPRDESRQGCAPSSLGLRMPAEWEPHERCIIGWPTEIRIGFVWGDQYLLAQASYAAVAHAIARFAPVLMLARPGEGGVARSYCGREIELVELGARGRPVLVGETPIVETSGNSYFANGALIGPTGGTGDDEVAIDRFREIVPDGEVVGVLCPVIGYGGSGIHCITQQVPRG
jgi:agmatine/peptidylarginine deiminase